MQKKLVYIHLGRCNCCPCRLLSVECRNLIGSHHNLVGYHKPRPGGPLHRIQVVLVGVGSGKEEIGNGRRLRRPVLVLSSLLLVEGLAEFHHAGPRNLEPLRGGEEVVELRDGVLDNFFVGTLESSGVEHRLDERSLPLLVVFPGGGEREVGKTGEFRVSRVEKVVDACPPSARLVPRDVHQPFKVLHLGDPSVETEHDRGDRYRLELVDVVKHGVFPEVFWQHLLNARHVEGSNDRVELPHLVAGSHLDPSDVAGHTFLVRVVDDVFASGLEVDLDPPVVEIFEDRVVQVRLRRPLEHPEHARLRPDGEEHEDGEHGPRGNCVTVDEPQGVGDGIPHAVERTAAPTQLREPLRERNVVELPDHVHSPVEVHQRAHNGGGAEPHRIVELVHDAQLLRPGEGLESVERRPDGELEVELPGAPPAVDEGVRVLLQPQVVERAGPAHDAEEVVVAAEEDVETLFDVVPVAVHPARHLAPDEGPDLEHLHLVARVGEIHCGDHAGESASDDADF
mmetsp:Transcript_14299/g.28536  ORF Transcript_14299/g.28536 Transcript_14299/m.28536 type:complete len:510 (-) Transcript_14299:355-1884(-)